MAAKTTNTSTETFSAPREHSSFRLDGRLIALIEDIARGVEEGDAGLKSCALGAVSAAANGSSAREVNEVHQREVAEIEDEDECFNRIGDLLAKGFTHAEIAKMVTLGGGSTHLLALERWCDRAKLSCNPDVEPVAWGGSALHERRGRARRALTRMRETVEGVNHAAVLHIAYGWLDPFVLTLPVEVAMALGRELAALARYTEPVEERRVEMARAEAIRNTRALARDSHAVADLAPALDRYEWALRVLSSGDAIRSATQPFGEPGTAQGETESRGAFEARKEARKARKLAHDERRAAFLVDVRIDANRMLTEASRAFDAAWKNS